MRVQVPDAVLSVSLNGSPIDFDFELKDASLDFDERNSVYVDGSVVLAPMPAEVYAQLDVSEFGLRVLLEVEQELLVPAEGVQGPFSFDLVVYGRERDADGTVVLSVASDELILELRAALASTDYGQEQDGGIWAGSPPWNVISSARQVVGSVLDEALGASLTSDAADAEADVSRRATLVNLSENPSFANSSGKPWTALSNASSIARSTARGHIGTSSLRWEATGAGNTIIAGKHLRVPTDQVIFHRIAVSAEDTARTALLYFGFYDGGGNLLGFVGSNQSATAPLGASNWGQLFAWALPWEIPAGAVTYQPRVKVQGAGAGEAFFIDAHGAYHLDAGLLSSPTGPLPGNPDLEPGDGPDTLYSAVAGWHNPTRYPGTGIPVQRMLPVYFDGSSVGTDDQGNAVDISLYTQSWDGPKNLSTSRLIPDNPIPPDLLIHRPGTTYRRFLDPIVELTGGRLFCDESRVWRLVDSTYEPTGDAIELADVENVVDLTERLDLSEEIDGVPTVFTGVVLEYEGVDPATGLTRVWRDVAGTNAGRVFRRRITDLPYPGPGGAAALLARSQGRVTQMRVRALADWRARPGLPASHVLESGNVVESTISKVGLALTADEMDLTLRDITTTWPLNHVQNPSPQDGTVQAAGWIPALYSGVEYARVAGAGVDGGYGVTMVWTDTSIVLASSPVVFNIGPITPGEFVWPSVHVKGNRDYPGILLRINFFTEGGSFVSGATVAEADVVAGEFVRIGGDVPVEVPATAEQASLFLAAPSGNLTSYYTAVGTRTNLARNPKAGVDTSDDAFSQSGGSATGSRITGLSDPSLPLGVTTARRRTWVTASPNPIDGGIGSAGAYLVEAGKTYALSVYGRPSWAGANTLARIYWVNSSNSIIGGSDGTIAAHAEDAWERRSVIGTAPAGAVRATLVFRVANTGAMPDVGDTLDATAYMLEWSDSIRDYFDGSSTITGRTAAWTGTAHASTSTLSGDSITIDRASTAPGPYFDGSFPDDTRQYEWVDDPYESPSRAWAVGYHPD